MNRTVLLLPVAFITLSACTAGQRVDNSGSAVETPYFESLANHSESFTSQQNYDTADDLLLNVNAYSDHSGSRRAYSDSVVVGKVIAVGPGSGFIVPEGDKGVDQAIDYDDPSADWRTVHLTVEVSEALGQATGTDSVSVGMVASPSTSTEGVAEAMVGRTFVFFLLEESPLFSYDAEVMEIVSGARTLIEVSDSGELTAPILLEGEGGVSDETAFLGGLRTLSDLRAAASRPLHDLEFAMQ